MQDGPGARNGIVKFQVPILIEGHEGNPVSEEGLYCFEKTID